MSAEMSVGPHLEAPRLLPIRTHRLVEILQNDVNAGGGTRTRTGTTLRCLRPLRLPFRHSG